MPDSGTLELVKSSCTYQGEGTFGKSCSSDGAQNCSRCFVPSSQKLRNNISYPEDENISCHLIGFKHVATVCFSSAEEATDSSSRSCRCIWLRSFYFLWSRMGTITEMPAALPRNAPAQTVPCLHERPHTCTPSAAFREVYVYDHINSM